MKLAIVGSTSLAGNAEVQNIIEQALDKYNPNVVVSGGAIGIDTMAEDTAKRRGIATMIFRPTVHRWAGKGGFKERNLLIAKSCDRLVRIVASDAKTYGSGWTRDRAKDMGKPTEEYVIQV